MVATNRHYTKGPCRAAQITVRGQKVWAVRCRNETVGIAYGGQGDAELWARSPRLLTELEHQIAIVQLREGELRASERASLERARALVNELT